MDTFENLPLGAAKGSAFGTKLTYQVEGRARPFSLGLNFVLTHVSSSATVDSLFQLIVNQLIGPLALIQSSQTKWIAVDLILLDQSNAPSSTSYHRRLTGLYGQQERVPVEHALAFRFELRSLPVYDDAHNPKLSPSPAYGLRTLNLRGVPNEFKDFDRVAISDHFNAVMAIAKLFITELTNDALSLRLKMPVQRPAKPIRLQNIVSADPVGLLVSPIAGPKTYGQ